MLNLKKLDISYLRSNSPKLLGRQLKSVQERPNRNAQRFDPVRNSYNHNVKGSSSFLGGSQPKFYEEYSPQHVRDKHFSNLRRSVEVEKNS